MFTKREIVIGPDCSEIYKIGISRSWAKGYCQKCVTKMKNYRLRGEPAKKQTRHVVGQVCAGAGCDRKWPGGKSGWSHGMCSKCKGKLARERKAGQKTTEEKDSRNAKGKKKKKKKKE